MISDLRTLLINLNVYNNFCDPEWCRSAAVLTSTPVKVAPEEEQHEECTEGSEHYICHNRDKAS